MPGQSWTNAEIARLQLLLQQGLTPETIDIEKRSNSAIRNKAARLKLIGDGIPRKQWSAKEEESLCKLMKKGWSVRRIAASPKQLPGHSIYSLSKKAGRLGIVDQERSRRAKQAIRFTDPQKQKFHQFLNERSDRNTPELIAILWNKNHEPKVSRRRVIYHQTRLNIKRPWKDVIRMRFSVTKRLRNRAKFIRRTKKRWNEHRKIMQTQFEHHARELRKKASQKSKSLAQRKCQGCSKRWPAMIPFFRQSTKHTGSGPRTYLSRNCRFCINRQRRKKLAAKKTIES